MDKYLFEKLGQRILDMLSKQDVTLLEAHFLLKKLTESIGEMIDELRNNDEKTWN